ncbi:U2 snRNP complex subunit [Serendipita sp. 396]|nr:U2 snRNP complex subunit [Serendipita sp. 396]KAG8851721.1 U2 snRNP complex subunit [Serendipita sp. 411]KAG8872834.1 U2 snRNP complex subunit [Serendipita sp. 405]
MKLTPELLAQAKTGLNPIKERQLDLRGLQIPAIENLGASRDQHDSIDLTDNSITVLGNLPLVRRLRTLHLANNRVMSISPNLHLSCPGLNMLVLSNNNLGQLGDLEPLKELRYLRFLSLLGNPVREQKYYREWIIFRCKSLRVLDFTRIKDKERKQGETLFLTPDSLETALASQLAATVTTNAAKAAVAATLDEPRASGSNAGRAGRLMTAEEKARIKAAIARAASAEEIKALERKLREGWVPEG